MALTREQAQTRFLAIVLPALTFCTHALLALSFVLPGTQQYRAHWSLAYNLIAASSSVLGFIGATRMIPSFVSAYTLTHTTALSLVTFALINILVPFDAGFKNPVIPRWNVDHKAICRDIDAGLGWDDEWINKCARSFSTVLGVIAWTGLFLMLAQWWALATVRRWGLEMQGRKMRLRSDVEKADGLREKEDERIDEKMRL